MSADLFMEADPQTAQDQPSDNNLKIHIPAFMPFFWLGCAVLAGVFASSWREFPWYFWLSGVLLGLIAALVAHHQEPRIRRVKQLHGGWVFLSFCLAALLYQLSLPPQGPANIAYYVDKGQIALQGVVVRPPEVQNYGISLTVKVESITLGKTLNFDSEIKGFLLVQAPPGTDFSYGDRLNIKGELIHPPEDGQFSYRQYLSHRGVYAMTRYAVIDRLAQNQGNPLKALLYNLRDRGSEVLNHIFRNPENVLLQGILLGDDSGLSPQLEEAYTRTGTMHIIAISGFNMAVLAGLITRLLTKNLGYRKGGLAAILVLSAYSILVGASASVLRAAIMGASAILGGMIGRKNNGLNSLGLCVFSMVLANPHIPWDIGFQLSVLASLGLILFADPLQARLEKTLLRRFSESTALRLSGMLSEYLLITLVAQLMVLPLLVFHFKEISWLFLIANPLILPAQPAVMVLGMLALLGGLIYPLLGELLAWVAWPFAWYSNSVVSLLAKLDPVAHTLPRIDLFWVILYYLVLLLLTLGRNPKEIFKTLAKPAYLILGLASLSVFVWVNVLALPDGKMHLHVYGGSVSPVVLLQSPTGSRILFSGALDANSLTQNVSRALPPLDRKLDILFIPVCKRDDVGGLFGLVEQVQIEKVLWGCDPARIQTTQRLYDTFEAMEIPQLRISAKDQLNFDGGGKIAFSLEEESTSAISVHFGSFSALIQPFEESPLPAPDSVLIKPSVPDLDALNQTCPQFLVLTDQSDIYKEGLCPSQIYDMQDFVELQIRTDGEKVWVLTINR